MNTIQSLRWKNIGSKNRPSLSLTMRHKKRYLNGGEERRQNWKKPHILLQDWYKEEGDGINIFMNEKALA